MFGFTDYNVDVVVKFGGSLLEDNDSCKSAVASLVHALQKGYRVVVIPGGGPTDNTIERLDKMYSFQSDTHHKSCARAQDQTGLMICDSYFSDHLTACENLEQVDQALSNSKVAVLLPSRIIFDMNPFEKIWSITSDSMAAWFAWVIDSKKFVIFKSVDGLYEKGKTRCAQSLIKTIFAHDLITLDSDVVDACVAPFLIKKKIDGYIINGSHVLEFINVLEEREFHGTTIIGG